MENTIKLERNSNGEVVCTDTAKRRGRPQKTDSQALKLVCQITGKARATNRGYLKIKAERLGVSVDEVINNYVSKEGLKKLVDANVDKLKKELLLKLNGGSRNRKSKQQAVKVD